MWWWLLTLSLTTHVLGGAAAEAPLSPLETTVTTTSTMTPSPVGPTGWTKFHSSWYKLFTEGLNYTMAAKKCRKEGADLAIVNSRDEHNFIEDLLKNSTWIGLDDISREGIFTWQDGSPLDFNSFICEIQHSAYATTTQ